MAKVLPFVLVVFSFIGTPAVQAQQVNEDAQYALKALQRLCMTLEQGMGYEEFALAMKDLAPVVEPFLDKHNLNFGVETYPDAMDLEFSAVEVNLAMSWWWLRQAQYRWHRAITDETVFLKGRNDSLDWFFNYLKTAELELAD